MKRLGSLILCASLLTACAGTSVTASPSAGPPSAPTGPTPTPVLATPCPSSPVSVVAFVDADPACFGDHDVIVRGWFAPPPPMGWEPPYNVKPWSWPDPPWVLWQRGPGGDAMCGGGDDCNWLALNVMRGSTLEFVDAPAWVVVTGHREDPLAEACHWEDGDVLPPIENARAECRTDFVVTAIAVAP